jgi:uncharacterized membrane protein
MRSRFVMLTGWQRLLCGAAAGIAVGFALHVLPTRLDEVFCGLIAWCLCAAVYLLPAWFLAETSDARSTRSRALALDQPRASILAIMVIAICVSVGVIAMLLQQVPQLCGARRTIHVVLGLAALASSWLMIHTIYAFHYAHRYYERGKPDASEGPGLRFPDGEEPDYFDFLYYAFVLGMTSQVSDVQVCSREMRRITLVHSVLSFGFNMLVLALSINVLAATVQGPGPSISGTPAQLDQPCR